MNDTNAQIWGASNKFPVNPIHTFNSSQVYLLPEQQLLLQNVIDEEVAILWADSNFMPIGLQTQVSEGMPLSDGGSFDFMHDPELFIWVSKPDNFVIWASHINGTQTVTHVLPVNRSNCQDMTLQMML